MLQEVNQRFHGSCMMLMSRNGEEVSFLGSCFLADPGGYLLTSSSAAPPDAELVVVPSDTSSAFPPVTLEEVTPVPVKVVARDRAHDTALLALEPDLDIRMPEGILGDAEAVEPGASLVSLGVPLGYYRVHGVLSVHSVLAGRLRTADGTRFLVFDRRVQYGDVGGPLISASDGRVVGIVGGVFDPVAFGGVETVEHTPAVPTLSYAVSIEYGVALLQAPSGV